MTNALLSLLLAFAGAATAPHGGVIKGSKNIRLEIVRTSEGLQIYPYDRRMRPVSPERVKVEGVAKIPRRFVPDPLRFAVRDRHLRSIVPAPAQLPYRAQLKIQFEGQQTRLRMQVPALR